MITFNDPQTTDECAARIGSGKKARLGKWLHQPPLEELEVVGEFMEYITGIGFDWHLVLNMPRMPIELAQEFFTSFRFTHTTNVRVESISFRLFTREMRMTIREWSVRLGLYNANQEVEWFERDIGVPKEIPDFNEQAAWEEIVPRGTEAYQPTTSRADCIKYPILRLVQVFVGANLLGQANTSTSVTEAKYFMWCMMKKRKVHLGYWIARTCQSISSRNGCHLLGAIFKNCVGMTVVERIPRIAYCPKPELFGTQFLTNVCILVQKGGRTRLYEVTKPGSQPVGAVKKKTKKKQMEVVVAEKEKETKTQAEATTSAMPVASPGHASLVELVGHLDDWRARMEGLN